jgi:hypothetical protein
MTAGNRSSALPADLYTVYHKDGKLFVSARYGSDVTETDIVGRIVVLSNGRPDMVTTEVSGVDDACEKLDSAGHNAYHLRNHAESDTEKSLIGS